VTINGKLVGEGRGSDVLGHPFAALAWLANTLAKRGTGISSGMTVITGSMVTPKFLDAGDTACFAADELGEVMLDVS